MRMIDERGRVFGRVNLVDFAALAFVLGLVPLAYGTYLLFRPSRPHIDSVTQVEITREERRVASSLVRAKFKVKGSGFNPLLRAQVDGSPVLGFVFENPNSADVLVGPVGPGAHDLVLFDGIQEVARAAGAIVTRAEDDSSIRAVGWFTHMEAGFAKSLAPGYRAPEGIPVFDIIAIGPPRPARSRVSLASSQADLPLEGRVEREVVVNLRCSAPIDVNPCNTNGRPLVELAPLLVSLPGFLRFEVLEVFPPGPPHRTTIRVGLPAPAASWPQADDRDDLLDERAATIVSVNRGASSATVDVTLGVDESREGWRYRSQLLKPGAPFKMTTTSYELNGTILSVAAPARSVGRQP